MANRRPIPGFADITYAFNGSKSRYRALQTRFVWRNTRDATVLSALTLSKTKDNGSPSLENANGNFPAPQDFPDLDADYGTSEYDQPVNSTTSFTWALPFGRDRQWGSGVPPMVDALIGGWQLAGINHAAPNGSRSSGAFGTITSTYDPRQLQIGLKFLW